MTNTNNQTKNTKTYEDKIANKEEQIKQLLNQKKKLVQKQKTEERKQRNSRLIRRHAHLEFFMKDLATITDDQFEAFIRTHINTNNGKNKLAELIGKGAEAASAYIAKCRAEDKARSEDEARNKENASDNSSSATPPKAEQSGA